MKVNKRRLLYSKELMKLILINKQSPTQLRKPSLRCFPLLFLLSFHAGAHTIGFAQCFTFKNRLFNFDGSGNPDPLLETSTLESLRRVCPNQDDSNTQLAPLDPVTSNKFDNNYFRNLVNNSGILQSDQALMGDNKTATMVINYSRFPFWFTRDFGASMVKMAAIGVLTGQDGEIRKNCRVVNQLEAFGQVDDL